MRIIMLAATAALIAFATPALATGNNNGPSNNCNGNGSCSQDTVNNTTNKGGNAAAGAVGIGGDGGQGGQGGQGGEGGNATQGQKQALKNDVKQSVNVEGDSYEAPRMVHLAPAVNVAPSANCALATGGSVGVLDLFSVGGSHSYIDEGCAMREAIRLGMSSNDPRVQSAASARLLEMLNGDEQQTSSVSTGTKQTAATGNPDWCSDPGRYAKFNGELFCN